MLKVGTGCEFFRLSTGSSDAPAIPPGAPLTWNLSSLPINNGKKAYKLLGLMVTIAGSMAQGASGVLIPQLKLLQLLIDSMELSNAFHGSPISPNHVKGYWLPTISYVGGGYKYASRNLGDIPSTNATFPFRWTVYIPLSMGNGVTPSHTAQLALFYLASQFTIQWQPTSVLTTYSSTSVLSSTSVRVSAVMKPVPEISVGPGVEWIDYQTTASANQSQVQLKSFGNTTQLNNTESGAGLGFAMAMSSLAGQPGAFDPANLTQVQIPFRGQINTTHIQPFLSQQDYCQGGRTFPGHAALANAQDINDFPYSFNNNVVAADGGAVPITTPVLELAGLLGLPLIPQSRNVRLSKMQVVNGDADYYLQLSSGPSGTHHTLCQQVRSWTPEFWKSAAAEIVRSGLAETVYGSTNLDWDVKMLEGDPSRVRRRKTRFLPMVLRPK